MVGSSPRLRGTRLRAICKGRTARFIPAPAGNTRSTSPSPMRRAVHPRACGEHPKCDASLLGPYGSSPRLRGTHSMVPTLQPSDRFIPAPAGNTVPRCRLSQPVSVHPRACGEHPKCDASLLGPYGSSPRLRGTPCRTADAIASCRFIPAPAGNTCPTKDRRWQLPVHPRACGEHADMLGEASKVHGSSPRLRGTLHRDRDNGDRTRFIPAPAGNTVLGMMIRTNMAVHPRACGEHSRCLPRMIVVSGSSPRLRGTR